MTPAQNINPVNYRLGPVLFRRVWHLVKPYWARREAWPAWVVLVALFVSIGFISYLSVQASFAMKNMTDALVAKDADGFQKAIVLYCLLFGATQIVPSLMGVFDSWLLVDWRKWLTMHLVDLYLAHRTYYDIALTGDLDNPDQRIQENVSPFLLILSSLPRMAIAQFATIVTGVVVLSSIDNTLIWAAIVFGILHILLTYLGYLPTIRQNFEGQVAEADLRHGLLHIRENAESIAFFSGEDTERRQVSRRLDVAAWWQGRTAYYNTLVNYTIAGIFTLIWLVLPYAVLSPQVISGQLTFGTITQGTQIAAQMLQAVTALTSFLPLITAATPRAVRLAHIQERLSAVEAGQTERGKGRISITRSPGSVHLRDVSVDTPGGEQQLVRDLSLDIEPGGTVAIIGRTGVGKSSLLRAMAGLWTRGSGQLEMPAARDLLFLPQRPYMILDTLRAQVLYPHGGALSDAELRRVLEAASLPDLLAKHGGPDAVRDWAKVLSLGEQQRVAFARILVAKPAFVFLDEATSAVDHATEAQLYELVAQSGAGYISIGHRASILQHHDRILTLSAGGAWSIAPAEQPEVSTAAPNASDELASLPLSNGDRLG